MEAGMQGTSFMTTINPLHSVFPNDPEAQFQAQEMLVLERLHLEDLLPPLVGYTPPRTQQQRMNNDPLLAQDSDTLLPHDGYEVLGNHQDSPTLLQQNGTACHSHHSGGPDRPTGATGPRQGHVPNGCHGNAADTSRVTGDRVHESSRSDGASDNCSVGTGDGIGLRVSGTSDSQISNTHRIPETQLTAKSGTRRGAKPALRWSSLAPSVRGSQESRSTHSHTPDDTSDVCENDSPITLPHGVRMLQALRASYGSGGDEISQATQVTNDNRTSDGASQSKQTGDKDDGREAIESQHTRSQHDAPQAHRAQPRSYDAETSQGSCTQKRLESSEVPQTNCPQGSSGSGEGSPTDHHSAHTNGTAQETQCRGAGLETSACGVARNGLQRSAEIRSGACGDKVDTRRGDVTVHSQGSAGDDHAMRNEDVNQDTQRSTGDVVQGTGEDGHGGTGGVRRGGVSACDGLMPRARLMTRASDVSPTDNTDRAVAAQRSKGNAATTTTITTTTTTARADASNRPTDTGHTQARSPDNPSRVVAQRAPPAERELNARVSADRDRASDCTKSTTRSTAPQLSGTRTNGGPKTEVRRKGAKRPSASSTGQSWRDSFGLDFARAHKRRRQAQLGVEQTNGEDSTRARVRIHADRDTHIHADDITGDHENIDTGRHAYVGSDDGISAEYVRNEEKRRQRQLKRRRERQTAQEQQQRVHLQSGMGQKGPRISNQVLGSAGTQQHTEHNFSQHAEVDEGRQHKHASKHGPKSTGDTTYDAQTNTSKRIVDKSAIDIRLDESTHDIADLHKRTRQRITEHTHTHTAQRSAPEEAQTQAEIEKGAHRYAQRMSTQTEHELRSPEEGTPEVFPTKKRVMPRNGTKSGLVGKAASTIEKLASFRYVKPPEELQTNKPSTGTRATGNKTSEIHLTSAVVTKSATRLPNIQDSQHLANNAMPTSDSVRNGGGHNDKTSGGCRDTISDDSISTSATAPHATQSHTRKQTPTEGKGPTEHEVSGHVSMAWNVTTNAVPNTADTTHGLCLGTTQWQSVGVSSSTSHVSDQAAPHHPATTADNVCSAGNGSLSVAALATERSTRTIIANDPQDTESLDVVRNGSYISLGSTQTPNASLSEESAALTTTTNIPTHSIKKAKDRSTNVHAQVQLNTHIASDTTCVSERLPLSTVPNKENIPSKTNIVTIGSDSILPSVVFAQGALEPQRAVNLSTLGVNPLAKKIPSLFDSAFLPESDDEFELG
ncbi:hypothetical protein SARC_03845 [Sphaeroforma arctica JP610]|uniref:Uncharacterized protein n=1 Tax=Sphaeroforma arctica JP610 TaxID=667725 RepID=A0A0L0G4E5_9EUKA|nr:hypothetical protein SARC_03845 [Sphaeroforma arctica JP610]KNC83930.1 hypothetical protein SARC_03845 [Sphaeroforma arctica JP610]|eukprot:XP_014157832.1 hypothetical protein SARC_03845 [Sphaeroforma arctica JP610]